MPKETNWREIEKDLKIRFHAFSLKMAEQVELQELHYSEIEDKMVDWWMNKLTQTLQQEREKYENCPQCTGLKEEYRDKLVEEIEKLKRTDHAQFNEDHVYDEALEDTIKIIKDKNI